MLDLSQFASQIFHFVSEDLEIKSNTPQVSEIQGNCFKIALFAKEQTNKKSAAQGKAVAKEQTCTLCDTGCVAMCMPCDMSRTEECDSAGIYCLEAKSDDELNH